MKNIFGSIPILIASANVAYGEVSNSECNGIVETYNKVISECDDALPVWTPEFTINLQLIDIETNPAAFFHTYKSLLGENNQNELRSVLLQKFGGENDDIDELIRTEKLNAYNTGIIPLGYVFERDGRHYKIEEVHEISLDQFSSIGFLYEQYISVHNFGKKIPVYLLGDALEGELNDRAPTGGFTRAGLEGIFLFTVSPEVIVNELDFHAFSTALRSPSKSEIAFMETKIDTFSVLSGSTSIENLYQAQALTSDFQSLYTSYSSNDDAAFNNGLLRILQFIGTRGAHSYKSSIELSQAVLLRLMQQRGIPPENISDVLGSIRIGESDFLGSPLTADEKKLVLGYYYNASKEILTKLKSVLV